MQVKINILGTPEPKQSTRFTKQGFSYQPKKVTMYKDNLKSQIITQLPTGFKPILGAVAVDYKFIFPWKTTHSKKKRLAGKIVYKDTKPDIDNLQKSVNDAMNSIVINDDSQICSAYVEKFYGDVPGITIIVRSIEV